MKLCRYGPAGLEKPGLIDARGQIRDLSGIKDTLDAGDLAPDRLAALQAIDPEKLPVVEGNPRYGVPFEGCSKIVCIGLNYSDHAAEAQLAVPDEPLVFMKAISALCGPDDNIVMPENSTKLDWEVELAVVIGTKASHVSVEAALDHVAGYAVANDVTERAFQFQSTQWDKGKGCDTFGPIGPWLVTKDEVPDPQNLKMWLDVNGERVQDGSTSNMIFGVSAIVSYLSKYMTLVPGDIVSTGTPAGVGMGFKPEQKWLGVGDVVTLGIEGLGQQTQKVVSRAVAA